MKSGFIALITDFSVSDPYVGIMKGAVLSRNPGIRFIDISHDVPPQDINCAAFFLMSSVTHMPAGTLILCVVDPGVGSDRKILWVKTEKHQIIAPDNGVISWVRKMEKIKEVRIISNGKLCAKEISRTFHGRDIMAPAAALICGGFRENEIGPVARKWQKIPFPLPKKRKGGIRGKILATDSFGNAVTNVTAGILPPNPEFSVKKARIKGIKENYSQAAAGEALALAGSSGFLEFSVRNGSFCEKFSVKANDEFSVCG